MSDPGIDAWIVLQLIDWASTFPGLARWAIFFSTDLPDLMAAVLGAYMLVAFVRQRRLLWLVPVVMIAAWLSARGIQHTWFRERPFDAGLVIALLPHRESGSFPSTHASVVLAVGWFLTRTRESVTLVWSWWISAALVCGGRVACGLHYPSDVVGGLIVGLVCAESALFLAQRRVRPQGRRAGPEKPPGTTRRPRLHGRIR